MRRVITLLICLMVMAAVFVMPASAESMASKVESYVTVTNNGDCMISTTVRLRLDSPMDSITFPVPLEATDITLNGGSARTEKTTTAIEVDVSRLAGGMAGEIQFGLNYNIPGAVQIIFNEDGSVNKTYLQLILPLMNSFELPVQELSFVITMPDNIRYKPTFSSIYQQTGIEASLKYDIDKNMMTGHSVTPLNDHEAITMNMVVDRDKFPTISTNIRQGNPEVTPMLIFAGLALVYWILFLRTWPLIRTRSVTPPEGITAGEIGCHLTLAGGDRTH